VRLHIFGIDGERPLQRLDSVRIAPLQEQNAADLVGGDTIPRVLLFGPAKAG